MSVFNGKVAIINGKYLSEEELCNLDNIYTQSKIRLL